MLYGLKQGQTRQERDERGRVKPLQSTDTSGKLTREEIAKKVGFSETTMDRSLKIENSDYVLSYPNVVTLLVKTFCSAYGHMVFSFRSTAKSIFADRTHIAFSSVSWNSFSRQIQRRKISMIRHVFTIQHLLG